MKDADERQSSVLLQGSIVGGRYEILRVVGLGSMGTVYVCRPAKNPKKLVAMKVLNPSASDGKFDANFLARFEREVSVAQMVQHPNVVSLVDVISEEHLAAHVLEYIPGGDLASYIRLNHPIPYREVARLLAESCAGVQAIHSAGILHRDLKPENILLTENKTAKISDFGLARITGGPNLTAKGGVVGTIRYLSPEYIESSTVHAAGDICALGLIGYEMVMGRSPYAAMTFFETIEKKVKEDLPLLSNLVPSCPTPLALIIDKAIRRSVPDRYQSVEAMRQDLVRLMPTLSATRDAARIQESRQHQTLSAVEPKIKRRGMPLHLLVGGVALGAALLFLGVILQPTHQGSFESAALQQRQIPPVRMDTVLNEDPILKSIEANAKISAQKPSTDIFSEAKGPNGPIGPAGPENIITQQTVINKDGSELKSLDVNPQRTLKLSNQSTPLKELPAKIVNEAEMENSLELPVPHSDSLSVAPEPVAAPLKRVVSPNEKKPAKPLAPIGRSTAIPASSLAAQAKNQADKQVEVVAANKIAAETVPAVEKQIQPENHLNTTAKENSQPPISAEFRVRSTLLYRFADYIAWPDSAFESPEAPLRLCIVGQDPFGNSLDSQIIRAKTRTGRNFAISRFANPPAPEVLKLCQLAYISSSISKRFSTLVRSMTTTPILLVGEGTDYAMIDFVIEDGKVKFEINKRRTQAAGLQISNVLLDLAVDVID